MNKSITNNIITNYNESFKTKIIINLIIILILILLIAIFKGPLFIKTTHNNLYYELFLDNEKIDKYTVSETYKSPLIPPFIYYKDYTSKNYNLKTNTYFRKDELDNFKLKIKSCYINNQNTSCQKKYDSTKNLDYKKNNLSMTIKYQNSNKYLYNDKLTSNIKKYISKPGEYQINISGKITKNINTNITFTLNIFN